MATLRPTGFFERSQLRPVVRRRNEIMRGALLWLLGIPIPIIILLYLFHVL